jgi:hypothetical protein
MCDRKLNSSFKNQSSTKPEILKSEKLVINYDDPTLFQNVGLYSGVSRTTSISGEIVLQIDGDICNFGNYLEANGNLKMAQILTGPYETKGGILEYRRLYFFFKDLNLKVKIRYNYDPKTICNGKPIPNPIEPQTAQDLSQNKILIQVDSDELIEFSGFIASNGADTSNINLQMQNLKPFFEDPKKGFFPFYDAFLINLNENSGFGKLIDQEFQRILCESNLEKAKIGDYYDKIEKIKDLNLVSVIFRKTQKP